MKRRKTVEWFADEMERRLRANSRKGGWKHQGYDEYYLERLKEEVAELEACAAPFNEEHAHAVIREAADVANFAMMIADRARR